MITGAQCRAARALVEWTRDKLASNSGVDALVIEEFERKIDIPDEDVCDTLQTALENAGAAFHRRERRRCRRSPETQSL